ncbi:MAG TPA: DNA/RNA non-specific endonuclease [Ignavibacteria bacterium]|nr:DNA/RNA non-specific endonuclease [Ignavibacteria bacterium]
MKNIKIFIFSYVILVCGLSFSITGKPSESNYIPQPWEVHVVMGIPTDNDNSDDYIITRDQYVLSYNQNKNVSNWACWNLNEDWFGDAPRHSGSFFRDNSLPDGFYRAKHNDYTNSGYERGHMVMSEQRTKNIEDNESTFILTNVFPQRADLNKGPWVKLEFYCNDLAIDQDKELYIIAGGVYDNDRKLKGKGKGKVTIPDSCYKIIVILNKGEGLADVDSNTQVIAVMMPNKKGIKKHKWQRYITTIDAVEYSTGYDFLTAVPVDVQEVLEEREFQE